MQTYRPKSDKYIVPSSNSFLLLFFCALYENQLIRQVCQTKTYKCTLECASTISSINLHIKTVTKERKKVTGKRKKSVEKRLQSKKFRQYEQMYAEIYKNERFCSQNVSFFLKLI